LPSARRRYFTRLLQKQAGIMGRSGSRRSALALLLLCGAQAAQASLMSAAATYMLNKAGNFVLGFTPMGGVQPQLWRACDQLIAMRKARGEPQAAGRLTRMKEWLSFAGIQKGIPAIAMEVFQHQRALTDAWGVVRTLITTMTASAQQDGWAAAWQQHAADVKHVCPQVMQRLSSSLPRGSRSRTLAQDLADILQTDTHLAKDILDVSLPKDKDQRDKMLGWLQKFLTDLGLTMDQELPGERVPPPVTRATGVRGEEL